MRTVMSQPSDVYCIIWLKYQIKQIALIFRSKMNMDKIQVCTVFFRLYRVINKFIIVNYIQFPTRQVV